MTKTSGVPLLLSGAFACALAASGCIRISANDTNHVETDEKTFSVSSSAPELDVDVFDGAIEVDAWDRPEIRVIAYKRGYDREAVAEIAVTMEQQGDKVVVKAREPDRDSRGWGSGPTFSSRSVRIVATVPHQSMLRLDSGDGRILVQAVDGRIVAETGDGSIRLDDVAAADVRTGDGSIRISGRLSDVRARTGDGSVAILADDGSHVSQDWNLATGDGAVVVELPEMIDAELDANTGDGRVVVRGLGVDVRARADRSLRTTLNSGGRAIRVRTEDGSITFRRR